MAFDESKTNRATNGQFAAKFGSAPEFSLGPEEETRNVVSTLFPGATSVEFVSFDLNEYDGYGPNPDEPDISYSVRKVMAGDIVLYDENDREKALHEYYDNWTTESPDFNYENPAEDSAAELQDVLQSLWRREGPPEALLNSRGSIELA